MLLGAVLALLLACNLFSDNARVANVNHRTDGSAVGWPQQGQAAFVLGNGRPTASPHEQPVPIASLAKVMTAYLTLERYPLSGAQDGFTITVSAAQAQAVSQDARQGQSVVAVQAGEQLTERQLIEALLIPSGNNIAQILATRVAGSQTRFIAEMNAEARVFGMDHTIYTDPSGFDPSTVSTAADQVRVFQKAIRFSVFRQIVSMAGVTLPVAGKLTNYNPLIAEGYLGKTGSDSAAGGCLAFFTHVMVGERPITAVGVVLGQGHGSDTSELIAAAGQAAQQLVESAAQANGDLQHGGDGVRGPTTRRTTARPHNPRRDVVLLGGLVRARRINEREGTACPPTTRTDCSCTRSIPSGSTLFAPPARTFTAASSVRSPPPAKASRCVVAFATPSQGSRSR
jgi:serine-type D-Ala-D-Ala carboxypeptidase (penicillin-binding protein 5/6)